MNRLTVKKRTWQESFEALQRYKAKHGNCLVPIHNYKEDLALGGWVNHQRSKKSKLTNEQIQKLDSMGFCWGLRVRNKNWNPMVEALKKFKKIHGHLEVPEVYQADQKLADFVMEQRAKYHKGQLSAARLKQLEQIGLVLKEEEEEEEEDIGLGWQQEKEEGEPAEEETAVEQDDQVEGGQEEETEGDEEEEDQEEDMVKYDNAFKHQFQKLVDFHIKFGHCRVPRFSRRGDTLGLWVSSMRRKYAENPETGMELRCHELLDELDFFNGITIGIPKPSSDTEEDESEPEPEPEDTEGDDDAQDVDEDLEVSEAITSDEEDDDDDGEEEDEEEETEEEESVSEAKSVSSKSGDEQSDLEVEVKVEEDPVAGNKRRLSETSSRCNYRDERFMKQYEDLLEFKREHGHCRVPQSKRFKTLGGWVNNLRVMYNRDPVNGVRLGRRKLLDEAGFIWNAGSDRPGNDARWEAQFENLLEFKKQFTHCRVPQTGPHRKLGRWVATQRALYVKDPVDGIRPDRLKRLNDVDFTWDAKGFKGRHFYSGSKEGATGKPPATVKTESDATESDEEQPLVAQVEPDRSQAVPSAIYAQVPVGVPSSVYAQAPAGVPTSIHMAALRQIVPNVDSVFSFHGFHQGFLPGVAVSEPAMVFPETAASNGAAAFPEAAASNAAAVFPQTTAGSATAVESQPLVKQVSLD